LQVILQLRPTRATGAAIDTCACNAAGAPMPDSCNSCGVATAPAAKNNLARRVMDPSATMPPADVPSAIAAPRAALVFEIQPLDLVCVNTARLLRTRIGCRKAAAALQRTPRF